MTSGVFYENTQIFLRVDRTRCGRPNWLISLSFSRCLSSKHSFAITEVCTPTFVYIVHSHYVYFCRGTDGEPLHGRPSNRRFPCERIELVSVPLFRCLNSSLCCCYANVLISAFCEIDKISKVEIRFDQRNFLKKYYTVLQRSSLSFQVMLFGTFQIGHALVQSDIVYIYK